MPHLSRMHRNRQCLSTGYHPQEHQLKAGGPGVGVSDALPGVPPKGAREAEWLLHSEGTEGGQVIKSESVHTDIYDAVYNREM